MQPGQTWVHSDTLGLIRFRDATVEVSPPSLNYPFFTMALVRWMKARMPFDFACTSISVNKDYAGIIHRDAFNAGPSALLALGDFTGGELEYWPEDNRSVSEPRLRTEFAPFCCDAKKNSIIFDGCRAHAVTPFEGNRFSLVFFTSGSWQNLEPLDSERMDKLGRRSSRPGYEEHRRQGHVPLQSSEKI